MLTKISFFLSYVCTIQKHKRNEITTYFYLHYITNLSTNYSNFLNYDKNNLQQIRNRVNL